MYNNIYILSKCFVSIKFKLLFRKMAVTKNIMKKNFNFVRRLKHFELNLGIVRFSISRQNNEKLQWLLTLQRTIGLLQI